MRRPTDPAEHLAAGTWVRADSIAGPSRALTGVTQGPFYAARFVLSDLGSKGGLVTDAAGRVLAESGTPVAGLYATSNSTASLFGPVYPGPGAPLGTAMVFGSLAVRATLAG